MNAKTKILMGILCIPVCVGGLGIISKVAPEAIKINAGIFSTGEKYSELMANYFKIEGEVGDTLEDFALDLLGAPVKNYTVLSPTNSLSKGDKGLNLIAEGTGVATIKAGDYTLEIEYDVKPGEKQQADGTIPDSEDLECTITAKGEKAHDLILYIDDSANAFKSNQGVFYIPKSYLDGATHSLYVAKFTKQGPVSYKISDFTTIAGEVGFSNYAQADVSVKGTQINLNTGISNLR